METNSEKFITKTKKYERKDMHRGLDLLLDAIEATTREMLPDTGKAIEGYTSVLKKYCITLLAMEEIKNAE